MYKEFRSALIAQTDDNEMTINPFPNFSESSLERNMEYWRRNRDLLIIFTGVYYILNIVCTTIRRFMAALFWLIEILHELYERFITEKRNIRIFKRRERLVYSRKKL